MSRTRGTFNLGVYNRRFEWQQLWAIRKLRDHTERWRFDGSAAGWVENAPTLRFPQFGDVTSSSVGFFNFRNCLALMAIVARIAFVLTSIQTEQLGAYAMVSPLVCFLTRAPNLFAREKNVAILHAYNN